jgi:hypothetical protein
LKDQLLSNVKQLEECYSELSNVFTSVFKSVDEPHELNTIKQEWIDGSSKIDKIDDSIKSLTKDKADIIKKIETIVNKKGKTTAAQNKSLSTLRDEWVEVSNQITVLHNQLEAYNKERAKLIKKTENYFSKMDASTETKVKKASKKQPAKKASGKTEKKAVKKTSAKKETVKKTSAKKETVKKTSAKKTSAKKAPAKKTSAKKAPAKKTSAKKTPAKKTSAKKTPAKKKAKKEESDDEKEATTGQVKLTLDSDSDSDTSESDTDSDLSSIESGDSDSDSDSSSSSEDEE